MEDRYIRQMILPGFGKAAQQKLQAAKVLVVGAGGLGCPALQYLVAAGVGSLGIADGDEVELSNLHRQILFGEEDLGVQKCVAAKQRLKALNPEVRIKTFEHFIDATNVFNLIQDYDLIIDSTDNLAVRFLLNDACSLLKKPLIFASIFRFEAQISVFHFGKDSRSLRDLYPEIPESQSIPRCSEAGTLGAVAGIVGNTQALEAIKILTGLGAVLSGKLLVMDLMNHISSLVKIGKNPEAFIPRSQEEILQKNHHRSSCSAAYQSIRSAVELHRVLQEENAVLVDVRNKEERPNITAFPSIRIPLDTLETSLEKLHSHDRIIFICQSGGRSLQAIEKIAGLLPDKTWYNVTQGISCLHERTKA